MVHESIQWVNGEGQCSCNAQVSHSGVLVSGVVFGETISFNYLPFLLKRKSTNTNMHDTLISTPSFFH
ncbi:unnamed protein product [Sphenostylis stenocarpa]|uniref:Uncharacterized protein n=1 Tax=Sphenostylis stenocarpa TaxID=92480 RepID=A0AA86RZB5_9FABA|nr:unnamed protein product [Sphenostylis stenocarpa]